MAVESNSRIWASWFETREDALLTMRVKEDLFLTSGVGTDLIQREREAMPPVSRTRCSVLHGAPQSRDPGRQWTPDQQRTASRCAASGARIPHPEERRMRRVSKDEATIGDKPS